ncbi:hypothetical protein [Sphaerisporangium sp. TRM90804]|uniref:hypothetical protein n=1 Tax=Sphaerisporangium sp. TRM90804 TaxID=3031113 RepID=UPI002448516F|nr:hypothetical protein [Sphaerisporangium sp. TRM90804]MDH2425833.1 hypothetical protein [Sphaerisporangium sp. TRM90804]
MATRVEQVVDRDSIRWIEQSGAALNADFYQRAYEQAVSSALADHRQREVQTLRRHSKELVATPIILAVLLAIITIAIFVDSSWVASFASGALLGFLSRLSFLLIGGSQLVDGNSPSDTPAFSIKRINGAFRT